MRRALAFIYDLRGVFFGDAVLRREEAALGRFAFLDFGLPRTTGVR
jgi:hypothetical protein